jgi:hypothetical protein
MFGEWSQDVRSRARWTAGDRQTSNSCGNCSRLRIWMMESSRSTTGIGEAGMPWYRIGARRGEPLLLALTVAVESRAAAELGLCRPK